MTQRFRYSNIISITKSGVESHIHDMVNDALDEGEVPTVIGISREAMHVLAGPDVEFGMFVTDRGRAFIGTNEGSSPNLMVLGSRKVGTIENQPLLGEKS
jgi:hypothetical protein